MSRTLNPLQLKETFLSLSVLDRTLISLSAILVVGLVRRVTSRSKLQTPELKGPPSSSFLYGSSVEALSEGRAESCKRWYEEYGPVFAVPWTMGTRQIIICDPKAVGRFYAKESHTFLFPKGIKNFIATLFGRGLIWAEREDHLRQRKALTPAFSNSAIRALTSTFFDSAYKMKTAWDAMIDSAEGDGLVIDVENWMNRVALDSIGIAGFGHDFGALDGKEPAIARAFDSFGSDKPQLSPFTFLLLPFLPILLRMTSTGKSPHGILRNSLSDVAKDLLDKAGKGIVDEKSIIGLLLKSTTAEAKLHMTSEEVLAQMNTLLLAGYETTSISLTWCLIELCRNPDKQTRLREELLAQFGTSDPTWDQLTGSIPYLDAVVHETLRTHPAVEATDRVAGEDEILPLSQPITTKSGEIMDSLFISKGTQLSVPIETINRLESFWGPDATVFKPERWLASEFDEGVGGYKDIQSYRHLLTFGDGPRTCIGKGFAVAEFKAVLSVLIRNFTFELPDGPDTEFVRHYSLIPRPKQKGQLKAVVPLRVRRLD